MVDILSGRGLWPRSGPLDIEIVNPKGDLVVGVCPHPNEPFGFLFLDLINVHFGGRVHSVIFNVDPPRGSEFHFLQEDSFYTFLKKFYLPPLSEQVEFSFGESAEVRSAAGGRALQIFGYLKSLDNAKYLMLHNDPFAERFYAYVSRSQAATDLNKEVDALVEQLNSEECFAKPLEPVSWTAVSGKNAYEYFKPQVLDKTVTTESAGVFLNGKGIPTATLEIPMFDWSQQSFATRTYAKSLFVKIQVSGTRLVQRKERWLGGSGCLKGVGAQFNLSPKVKKRTVHRSP